MRLKEAWQTKGWVKLAAAVIINAVFLALMLTCFAPVYETNDDLFLSKFVDGQLSHRKFNNRIGELDRTAFIIDRC